MINHKRMSVFAKWAVDESLRHRISFAIASANILRHYRKMGRYMDNEYIEHLKAIEAGANYIDINDKWKALHGYTFEDDNRRLWLRESGYVLLYAIQEPQPQ